MRSLYYLRHVNFARRGSYLRRTVPYIASCWLKVSPVFGKSSLNHHNGPECEKKIADNKEWFLSNQWL